MIFSSDTKYRRWWQMDAVSGSQSPVTDYGKKKTTEFFSQILIKLCHIYWCSSSFSDVIQLLSMNSLIYGIPWWTDGFVTEAIISWW